MSNSIISIIPFSAVNDLINWNEEINNINQTVYPVLSDLIIDDNTEISFKTVDWQQPLKLQESFLYVCTETVFNYPHVYLTEKSYKGILTKRPFVIVGVVGSLQLLKEYGFKTFDKWWSEDYDSELSNSKRLLKIYAIIEYICNLTELELQDMCKEMESILEYNFIHYNTFGLSQINDFNQQCISNLNQIKL